MSGEEKPTMTTTAANDYREALDRFLNPIRDALTPETAKAIAELRADEDTQQRIETLADRHHEGHLNDVELVGYQALVQGANLMAILQASARSVLNRP